nr:MAG TPA: hypothetical protein [Caudoviricetes sp.]
MYTLSDFIKEFGNPKRIITRRKRNENGVYTVRWPKAMMHYYTSHHWDGKTVQLQNGIIVKKGDFL